MKPSEIEVGKTYRNCGAGTTQREVKAISPTGLVEFWDKTHYWRKGTHFLSLNAFSQWAGSVVEPEAKP